MELRRGREGAQEAMYYRARALRRRLMCILQSMRVLDETFCE